MNSLRSPASTVRPPKRRSPTPGRMRWKSHGPRKSRILTTSGAHSTPVRRGCACTIPPTAGRRFRTSSNCSGNPTVFSRTTPLSSPTSRVAKCWRTGGGFRRSSFAGRTAGCPNGAAAADSISRRTVTPNGALALCWREVPRSCISRPRRCCSRGKGRCGSSLACRPALPDASSVSARKTDCWCPRK